jgi:FkbM family methyltransferase
MFEKLVLPGFTVVDVGANQGLYSLLFSSLVGPTGGVLSFEPDADLFAALRVNCRQNGAENIRCYNYALGARAEAKVLYRSRVNSGDNRLARSDRPDWFHEVDVKTETLDSMLGNTSVDFIKIDVQGWELEVLKGMTGVCNNNPELRIYFEFWPFALRRAGCDPMQILQHLRQNGFSLYDTADVGMRPLTEFVGFCAKFDGYKATNILAVRLARKHKIAYA